MSKDNRGRNDPCWCGSGKKYKKCHLPSDSLEPTDGSELARSHPESALPIGASPTRPLRHDPLALHEEQREAMRKACKFNAELLDVLRPHVREGQSTGELDRLAMTYTQDHGHRPACLNYLGYPKVICTSVNEVVCHGIPSDQQILKSGDIVNVDLTTVVNGWFGDQSETFMIGEVSPLTQKLVQVTYDSLFLAIDALVPGCSVNEVGRAITPFAESHGFSVVREYQGHGIGQKFHQDPSVLHVVNPHLENVCFEIGHCFTIEPMINEGTWKTDLDSKDGWTVRTKDRKNSAQFEHTILMTESGPEILTLTKNGPQPGDTIKPVR